MKRTITTLMVCVSAYALIAQEAPKVYNDYTPKIYYFHKCHILYIYFPKMDEETKKTLFLHWWKCL